MSLRNVGIFIQPYVRSLKLVIFNCAIVFSVEFLMKCNGVLRTAISRKEKGSTSCKETPNIIYSSKIISRVS
jgi:hypothetical protein